MKTTSALLLAALAGAAAVLQSQAAPLDIGGRKQLFIDHRFVEQADNLELLMMPPEKRGVVLAGTESWEDGLVTGAGTVIEDGKFRMWYTATPASGRLIEDNQFRLCYAESEDGIHWTKPDLGLYEWRGSRANNILLNSEIENGGGVFIDPTAPVAERYRLLARIPAHSAKEPHGTAPDGSGLYIYTSADGLRWNLRPRRVFPYSPDTVNMALYDPPSRKYLAFVRTWIDHRRRVGVVETDDITKPWPYDKTIAATHLNDPVLSRVPSREIPDAFGADPDEPASVDHYTSAVVRYPWADDAYFMFPSFYRHVPPALVGGKKNDGPLDIQMAVSRDGRKYHRVTRAPYIEDGLKGSKDSGSMYMYIGMLRRNDSIYQYYGGFDWTHGAYHDFPELHGRGSVMLVKQRLDGFVAAAAGEKAARFETPEVVFSGQRLELNVDASASGEVEVELRDPAGNPLGGFSFAQCDPIWQNDVAHVVTWRSGDSAVGALAGKPVRVAFRLQEARIFAFQFTGR